MGTGPFSGVYSNTVLAIQDDMLLSLLAMALGAEGYVVQPAVNRFNGPGAAERLRPGPGNP